MLMKTSFCFAIDWISMMWRKKKRLSQINWYQLKFTCSFNKQNENHWTENYLQCDLIGITCASYWRRTHFRFLLISVLFYFFFYHFMFFAFQTHVCNDSTLTHTLIRFHKYRRRHETTQHSVVDANSNQ